MDAINPYRPTTAVVSPVVSRQRASAAVVSPRSSKGCGRQRVKGSLQKLNKKMKNDNFTQNLKECEELRKKKVFRNIFRGLNRTVGPIRFKIEIWPGEGLPEGW